MRLICFGIPQVKTGWSHFASNESACHSILSRTVNTQFLCVNEATYLAGFGSRHSRTVVDNGEVAIDGFLLSVTAFWVHVRSPPEGVHHWTSKPWTSVKSPFAVRVVNVNHDGWPLDSGTSIGNDRVKVQQDTQSKALSAVPLKRCAFAWPAYTGSTDRDLLLYSPLTRSSTQPYHVHLRSAEGRVGRFYLVWNLR